jgi:hypothetical protein
MPGTYPRVKYQKGASGAYKHEIRLGMLARDKHTRILQKLVKSFITMGP